MLSVCPSTNKKWIMFYLFYFFILPGIMLYFKIVIRIDCIYFAFLMCFELYWYTFFLLQVSFNWDIYLHTLVCYISSDLIMSYASQYYAPLCLHSYHMFLIWIFNSWKSILMIYIHTLSVVLPAEQPPCYWCWYLCYIFNSLRPGDACRLVGAKPLSEPMLGYC